MGVLTRFAGRRIDATTATAVALAVGSAALRLPHLRDPFWQDEVASARILTEPSLGRVLGHVARTESTPPLWYVAGWLLHQGGPGVMEVRLFSVACGALFAALVVVAARRVVSLWPAAVAGLLVAVGGQFAFAARELRAYALLALLSVVFVLVLDAQRTRPRPVLLALVTGAGLLTHYFFAFTVVAGILWVWLDPAVRAVRVRTLAALCAGGALAVPWLPYALRQYRQDRYSWIGPFDGRVVLDTPFRLFTPLVQIEWVALVFLGLFLVGAWRLARSSAFGRLVAACGLVPIALAGLLWLAGVRVYAFRNLVEAGAFVAIAGVAAVTALPRRAAVTAATALVCAAGAGFVVEQLQPAAPYSQIAGALVSAGWQPNDPVLVLGSPYAFRSPLEWYLPRGPRLAVLGVQRPSCGVGFVVAAEDQRRAVAEDLVRVRRVGEFLVGRARLDDAAAHGSLLGTERAWVRCSRSLSA